MGKYDVLDIAKYFIDSELYLSNKKLQKLVYYAYVWYLVKNNNSNIIKNKLFESKIEAWVHGPVCPKLYYAYNNNTIRDYNVRNIDHDTKKLLEMILAVYGKYNGDTLESFTHREMPWKKAREGYATLERCAQKIEDKDIYEFYSNQIK